MNLSQLRTAFAKLSGRYDLGNEDPDMTDFLINQACRFLDRNSEMQKTWASYFGYLTVNSWYLEFPLCRAVKEVWAANDEGERWQLEKVSLQDMLSIHLPELVSGMDTGSPTYYCPAVTRKIPEGTPLPAGITSYIDVLSSSGHQYNSVLIAPAADESYLIDVKGFFYSSELVNETDENYWSTIHPLTLLKAALREVEVFNQNDSKVKLWESAIFTELESINKDLVEEIIAEVDQMEG